MEENTSLSDSVMNAAKDIVIEKYGMNHQKKTEIQRAAIKFNFKPKNGINYLKKNGLVASEPYD